jgi:hypothetical protein
MQRRLSVLARATERKGGTGISHSANNIRKRNTVWKVIWRENGLVADMRTDFSRGANNNVIVPDVRRSVERLTRIGKG